MLSYALAIAVTISSLLLFLTAFVMSDIHRRDDFLWSGVGLFYAAVLWFCARNITGAVLLGQTAATVLSITFTWQTLKLRKALANPERATEISNFSILRQVNSLLKRNRPKVQPTTQTQTSKTPIVEKVTESEIAIPDNLPKAKTEQTDNQVVPNKPAKATEKTKQDPLNKKAVAEEVKQDKNEKAVPSEPPTQATKLIVEDTKPEEDKTAPERQMPTPAVVEKPITEEPLLGKEQKAPESTPKPKDIDLSPTTDTKQAVEKPTTDRNEAIAPPETEKASKKSHLDSLETVEVAEILEADPEEARDRQLDRANDIEVTTTEINITTTRVSEIQPDSDQKESEDKP